MAKEQKDSKKLPEDEMEDETLENTRKTASHAPSQKGKTQPSNSLDDDDIEVDESRRSDRSKSSSGDNRR